MDGWFNEAKEAKEDMRLWDILEEQKLLSEEETFTTKNSFPYF